MTAHHRRNNSRVGGPRVGVRMQHAGQQITVFPIPSPYATMAKCPYHRSDFCTHGGQTVTVTQDYCSVHKAFNCEHVEAEPAPEVVRCSCGKRASVTLRLLLPDRGPTTVSVCPSCYPDTITKGQILKQDTFLLPE